MLNRELSRKAGLIVMLAALVAVIALRYAEPILDGDLFWHFAYAKQMVEHHTLVPDPTIYSWTPTNNRMIYCTWLSELALYGLWNAFGMAGLFVLRYLVIAAIAGLFWSTVRRARFAASPATLLVTMMLAVTAYLGSLQKPELFSLLFYHCALWCYFQAKLAAREGEDPRPWFYAVPLLTLVWANTHGAHVLFATFLASTAIGELLTCRFSPAIAFSSRQLKHLAAAWASCGVAVCLTPYGVAYPLQNLSALTITRPDAVWNIAHRTIYASGAAEFMSLPQVFAVLAAALIMLFLAAARRQGSRGRVDYALALGLAAYLPLSVQISRAGYLWPALACYALVYLAGLARGEDDASQRPSPLNSWWIRNRQLFAAFLFAIVALRNGYDAYAQPDAASWLGFGVSYHNPVPEAEFLARAKLGPRFYNTFDSGGYLLWRLYPRYLVMSDSRSFPYLDWFQDQYRFVYGTNFREFLARYPADLAIIDLNKEGCWRNFVRADGWHLLFYGPTAAIFARGTATAGRRVEKAGELLRLRNASTAFMVFDFSVVIGDHEMAWNILTQLETTLAQQADATLLKRARSYRAAHAALARGDYDAADALFSTALSSGIIADRDMLILTLLHGRRKLLEQGNTAAVQTVNTGLDRLALTPAQVR